MLDIDSHEEIRRANKASQICGTVALVATVVLIIILAVYIGPRSCGRDNISVADFLLLSGCR